MKTIVTYSLVFPVFVIVIASLFILNVISMMMLAKMKKSKEEESVNDDYSFAGFELCNSLDKQTGCITIA